MAESGTELDFLDDLTPISQAIIPTTATPPSAYANLPTGSFIVINGEICFKKFETRYSNGLGDANLSGTLDQIRGTSGFRDLCSLFGTIVTLFHKTPGKRFFFFGKHTNQNWHGRVTQRLV